MQKLCGYAKVFIQGMCAMKLMEQGLPLGEIKGSISFSLRGSTDCTFIDQGSVIVSSVVHANSTT